MRSGTVRSITSNEEVEDEVDSSLNSDTGSETSEVTMSDGELKLSEKSKKAAKRAEQYCLNFNNRWKKLEKERAKFKVMLEEVTASCAADQGSAITPHNLDQLDDLVKTIARLNKDAVYSINKQPVVPSPLIFSLVASAEVKLLGIITLQELSCPITIAVLRR